MGRSTHFGCAIATMVDNNYAVVPNFPLGVILSQLREEMVPIWPADVFPIFMIYRSGAPGVGGVITVGTINIVTQRVLTAPEDAAAFAFFPTFVPLVGGQGGMNTADLGPGAFNGETVFVLDAARQTVGAGVLAYWDGRDRNWRRIHDDVSIAVIP